MTLARHSLHYFKNIGAKPARMLIMVTPAGLENFFRAVGREAIDGETEAGSPDARGYAESPQGGSEVRA